LGTVEEWLPERVAQSLAPCWALCRSL